MIPVPLARFAADALERFAGARLTLATAESCTGGLVAAALTSIAGSSRVVDRGFITYSNAAKQEMLGVPLAILDSFGAVSDPVARAMAEGALSRSAADVGLAITGIAGPGGGTPSKPVGLVHWAAATRGGPTHAASTVFTGDRAAIRGQAATAALALALAAAGLAEAPADSG